MTVSITCTLEISAELEPFPDAAFRVRRVCLLDLLHLNPTRTVLTLPEQTVDERLSEHALHMISR